MAGERRFSVSLYISDIGDEGWLMGVTKMDSSVLLIHRRKSFIVALLLLLLILLFILQKHLIKIKEIKRNNIYI